MRKEDLKAALALLGPNGENWVKKPNREDEMNGRFCAVTACIHTEAYLAPWLRPFVPASYPTVASFNDAPATTFTDIKRLFEDAIEAAQ